MMLITPFHIENKSKINILINNKLVVVIVGDVDINKSPLTP